MLECLKAKEARLEIRVYSHLGFLVATHLTLGLLGL